MLANTGDVIELTKEVAYGTIYGLVKLQVGTILNVNKRNTSDDGIETEEMVTLKNELGEKSFRFNVWDKDYIILN